MRLSCKDSTKKFGQGINFEKLFLIFVIGSIIGVFYEEILTIVKNFYNFNSFIFESRRGVIYGPLNPLYGLGFVVFTYVLGKKDRKWYITLLYGSLLGGVVEYGVSFLQEVFVGTSSWNYSNLFLNINGRTTIPYMFFWGLAGLIYIKVIYPPLSKMIESINYNFGRYLVIFLVIFYSLDMFISFSALIRQNLRKNGIKPYTVVGVICDEIYTDDYLKKAYPNMEENSKMHEVNKNEQV